MSNEGKSDNVISFDKDGRSMREDPDQNFGGGGGGSDIPSRLGRLEVHVEYIQRDIGEIKTDIKTTSIKLAEIDKKLDTICAKFNANFTWIKWLLGSLLLPIYAAVAGALLHYLLPYIK